MRRNLLENHGKSSQFAVRWMRKPPLKWPSLLPHMHQHVLVVRERNAYRADPIAAQHLSELVLQFEVAAKAWFFQKELESAHMT